MSRQDDIQRAIEHIKRVKPYFWKPPSAISWSLTWDTVKDVEQAFGHTLPDSYLAIMMIQNGGMPRYWAYGDESDHLSVGLFHGLEPITDILSNVDCYREWVWDEGHDPTIADKVLPLTGDGHWWVLLDYRKPGTGPSVSYTDFELDIIGERLAPTFMAFVEGLYDADDVYYFGFANTGADTKDLRKALEDALDLTEFEVVEDTDRDLPEYHARRRAIPPAVSPETFKLQRNRHDLPESTAYQSNLEFPMHPECDWLLEANIEQKEQEQLEQMLGTIPFEVIALHIPPWDRLDH